ncbi:DUF6134 family protein [Candidatus Uabimicrobium sp. HlEnr_7]|uniref:DUF6134 family protein n=1 Tax=Candidatus Uabimicrobium helgolandensis TaxID=3095367 RepID=UPI003559212C
MHYLIIFFTIVLLGCHCQKANTNYSSKDSQKQLIRVQELNTEILRSQATNKNNPNPIKKNLSTIEKSFFSQKNENLITEPKKQKEKSTTLSKEDKSNQTNNNENSLVAEEPKKIITAQESKYSAKLAHKKPQENHIVKSKEKKIPETQKSQAIRFSVLRSFPPNIKEKSLKKQSASVETKVVKKDTSQQKTISIKKITPHQKDTDIRKDNPQKEITLQQKTAKKDNPQKEITAQQKTAKKDNPPKEITSQQQTIPIKENTTQKQQISLSKEIIPPVKKIEEKPIAPIVVKAKTTDEIVQEKFIALAGTYEYEVYVEGNLSGSQKMVVTPQENGSVVVKSTINFSFRALLFFTITYEHFCKEVWQNGQLQSLTTNTVKNGTKIALKLQSKGKKMIGALDGNSLTTLTPIATNNAWNLGVSFIHRQKYNVINPEDGTISLLDFSQKKGKSFNLQGKRISTSYLKSKNRNWEFWFSPRNVMLKQKDVLKGYTVEITLKKMSKNN